jgi:hypothetical protein
VYAVPAPELLRGTIESFQVPFFIDLAEHVTFEVPTRHENVLRRLPYVAVTVCETPETLENVTVTDPRAATVLTPVGLEGTGTVDVVVAPRDSSAVTRMVGDENVKPLASIRNVVPSDVTEVVETFEDPVESSMTDTLNCFVEAIFGPHRHCAVSCGMRAW